MIKKCPKCGFKNHHFEVTSSSKCQICGIVYSKYKKRGGQYPEQRSDHFAGLDRANDVLENGENQPQNDIVIPKEPRIPLGVLWLIFFFGNLFIWVYLTSVYNFTNLSSIIPLIICIGISIASFKALASFKAYYEEWERQSAEKKAKESAQKIEYENAIIADARSRIYEAITNNTNFSITDSFITDNHKVFIAVDEKKRLFVIGDVDDFTDKVDYRIISTKDILGVEVTTESGKSIFTSSPESSLGAAAVGGLLFGGAGAIVGAIAGSNTNSNTQTKEISLRISIDNIKTPYIGINFLSEMVEKDSDEYQQALKNSEKWFGIVKILLAREKNERGKNSESMKISRAT